MKTHIIIIITVFCFGTVDASMYFDATGDLNDDTVGTDFSSQIWRDIDLVEIVNDLSTITFTISTVADIDSSPSNGKYTIGIDSVAGGDPAGNGWGRPISMSSGMDYWIGSWVDVGGGAQLWTYSGSWAETTSGGISIEDDVSLTFNLADLGLSPGDTFMFDVYTTGPTPIDGAVDALSLSTPSITSWTDSYDSGVNIRSYTVVPEPSAVGIILLGGVVLAVLRQRNDRTNH